MSVNMDILLVFCALVLATAFLSLFVKLIASVIRLGFLWMNRKERAREEAVYENRFARLAEEAANGPILLADMRMA